MRFDSVRFATGCRDGSDDNDYRADNGYCLEQEQAVFSKKFDHGFT